MQFIIFSICLLQDTMLGNLTYNKFNNKSNILLTNFFLLIYLKNFCKIIERISIRNQIFDIYRYIVAQGAMHEPGKTKQKYKLAENRNSNK